MHARHRLALFASAALTSALTSTCTIEVDLAGKGCPCSDGHRCIDGACVKGECLIAIENFRASWATPHGIQWQWDPRGKEEDFQAYELVTGPTKADVEKRTALSRTWTKADNPELGIFTHRRTAVEDLVTRTITDGLDPSTLYHAKLIVTDGAGCVAESSNIAGKSTTDAAPRRAVMQDTAVGTWGTLEHTASGCYGGTPGCWLTTVQCPNAEPMCFYNAQRGGLGVPLADEQGSALTEGGFATAYVELRVRNDVPTQSWYGVFLLLMGDGRSYRLEPVVYSTNSDYETLEVPLSALVLTETFHTPNQAFLTLADTGGDIDGVLVGLLDVPNGSHIYVDEVKLGW